jgi:hypothetical protein
VPHTVPVADGHLALARAGTGPLISYVVRPPELRELVLGGAVAVRDGELVPGGPLDVPADERWLGTWLDRSGEMDQTLSPDGRYDETRSGRRHAWTGRWWGYGDTIVYLDDTGFWAFGERHGDTLHHASFVMQRAA